MKIKFIYYKNGTACGLPSEAALEVDIVHQKKRKFLKKKIDSNQ